MSVKSNLNKVVILFSVICTIITGFLATLFSFNVSFFWFTIIPAAPPIEGRMCTEAIIDSYFGWPLSFLRGFGGNGCQVDLLFNPAGLIINLAIFYLLGYFILQKKLSANKS